jgi:hypothetical protein
MRRLLLRFLVLVVVTIPNVVLIAGAAAHVQSPLADQPGQPVDLTAITASKKDVRTSVRCRSGELMHFWSSRIQTVDGTTITLKPGTYTTRVPDAPAIPSALEREALIRLSQALGSTTAGEYSAGQLKVVSGPKKEATTCEVVEVWAPIVDVEAFDKPVVLSQLGFGGNVEGSATIERIKAKNKPKTEACVVATVPAPAWADPVPGDLQGIFTTVLMAPPKKGTKVPSRDALPSGASANELTVMFFGTGSEEKRTLVANAMFMVTDGAGRLLTRGHAYRTIGKKRDQDVRELAGYIACN